MKKLRVTVIMDAEDVEFVYHVMALAFGKENVKASTDARHLFGILQTFRPTTLIIDPSLFDRFRINAEDINAFRRRIHYHIIAVYPNEEALKSKRKYRWLFAKKEYVYPIDYLQMVDEIPELSKNPYVFRRKNLICETRRNINRIMTDCGFHCEMKGAEFLKEALFRMYFDPDLHRNGGATKLYRRLAEEYGTTPRIIERSMLRFLETSWKPSTEAALREELNIPENRDFLPLNFRHFTEVFNTYYTIKYRDAKENLKTPKRIRY